jgi:hypothetical protein
VHQPLLSGLWYSSSVAGKSGSCGGAKSGEENEAVSPSREFNSRWPGRDRGCKPAPRTSPLQLAMLNASLDGMAAGLPAPRGSRGELKAQSSGRGRDQASLLLPPMVLLACGSALGDRNGDCRAGLRSHSGI